MVDDVTLREHLEAKIQALCAKHELKFKGIEDRLDMNDDALKIQALANKEHFLALNHEAARIQAAADKSVSRDTWDAHKQNYDDWVRKVELALGGLLPSKDFNIFKEEVNKTLQTKTGQSQGIGMTTSSLVTIIVVVGVIAGVVFGIVTLAVP